MFILRFDSKETAQRVLRKAVAGGMSDLCVSYQMQDRHRVLYVQDDGTLLAVDDGGGSTLDLDEDCVVFYQ